MDYLRVSVRVVAVCLVYLGFAVVGVVLQSVGFIAKKRRHHLIAWFTSLWAHCSCVLFNIRVETVGDFKVAEGSLVVANHVGAPDIFVLGKCFPGFFVSKAEIAQWPLFSYLARLGRSYFCRARQTPSGQRNHWANERAVGRRLLGHFVPGRTSDRRPKSARIQTLDVCSCCSRELRCRAGHPYLS